MLFLVLLAMLALEVLIIIMIDAISEMKNNE